MKKSLLRLFNAIQVQTKHSSTEYLKHIKKGILIHPCVPITTENMTAIDDVIGISGEKINSTFRKSWSIIEKSTTEELALEQIRHYMSTYGSMSLGTYNIRTVYIPKDKLDIPELTDDLELTFINALTKKEVIDRIIKLSDATALSESTIKDIMTIVSKNNYDKAFVDLIKNKELKGMLCDFYNIIPQVPIEFLRYTISKLTGESLIIKNDVLIGKIKNSNGKLLDMIIKDAPTNLSSIFLRYKPLFLAMKNISKNKTFFNRLRKDSIRTHVPLAEDYLNNVTKHIKNKDLDFKHLESALETANIFRKIKLANSLKYRINPVDSIVYNVRNGRGWADDFKWDKRSNSKTKHALDIIIESISNDIRPLVENKTFYIPSYIKYALPATEKQFTGNFPSGTYVYNEKNTVIGINWHNLPNEGVDLDLSLVGTDGKIGWDEQLKTGNILFSGDQTTAPGKNGASESFLIKNELTDDKLVYINDYGQSATKEEPVNCKIFIGYKRKDTISDNYMLDPNKTLAVANIDISTQGLVIGVITHEYGVNKFYFAQTGISNGITSSNDEKSNKTRKYLVRYNQEKLLLNEILEMSGANIVSNKPTTTDFVDLSPMNLTKDSILNLLK